MIECSIEHSTVLVNTTPEGRTVITNVFINLISSIWIHLYPTNNVLEQLQKQLTVSGGFPYWNLENELQCHRIY
jgi:hypothetical protein